MGTSYVRGAQRVMSGPPILAARDLFTESATQLQPLGSRVRMEDGREFVYCKNGASALDPGKIVTSPAEVANHTNCAVAAAAAAGACKVTVTLGATAVTKDQYAGGFLYVNDEAGEGTTYKINSHPAADASAAVIVTLDDEIRTALTTSSQVSFVYNKFANLVVAPTTAVGTPVGVPPIAVTAAYYFWAQCSGPCGVLQIGTLVAGANAVVPTATAGGVGPSGASTSVNVGRVMQIAATTEYAMIDLAL